MESLSWLEVEAFWTAYTFGLGSIQQGVVLLGMVGGACFLGVGSVFYWCYQHCKENS